MDENITNQGQEVELGAEADSAFDDGWADETPGLMPEADGASEAEEPDAQPEPEAEEGSDPEDKTGEEPEKAETEPEQGTQDEAGSQRYNLKFLGEDREVSLDEMRDLAEKGLNYDHVKADRDSLRERTKNIDEMEGALGFLKELAENSGTTVGELMDATRARILVQKAEAEGKELTEEQALAQVRANKQAKQETAPAKSEEEMRQEAVRRFIALYPGVKSEDIPKSVWEEADRLGDLIGPYQKYESKKLRDELAQLKQNQKNRERSTGSRRTVGATTPKDAFDEGWDS